MDTFKTLHFSDTHLSNSMPYCRVVDPSTMVTDRLLDQLEVWKWVMRTAENEGVECVIHHGDVFDKPRIDSVTLGEFLKAAKRRKGAPKTYVLPGNHEGAAVNGGRFLVELFDHVSGNYEFVNKRSLDLAPWIRFHFYGWDSIPGLSRSLDEIEQDDSRTQVLIMHHSITGGLTDSGHPCNDGMPHGAFYQFDQVMSGHFHKPHNVTGDGRVMYVGAPMQYRFADSANVPCIRLATWERGAGLVSVEDIVNEFSPRFIQAKVDIEEADALVSETVNCANEADYIDFKISCTKQEWTDVENSMEKMLSGIEPCRRKRITYRHALVYSHEARLDSETGGDAAAEIDTSKVDAIVQAYLRDGSVKVPKGLSRRSLYKAALKILAGGER